MKQYDNQIHDFFTSLSTLCCWNIIKIILFDRGQRNISFLGRNSFTKKKLKINKLPERKR